MLSKAAVIITYTSLVNLRNVNNYVVFSPIGYPIKDWMSKISPLGRHITIIKCMAKTDSSPSPPPPHKNERKGDNNKQTKQVFLIF